MDAMFITSVYVVCDTLQAHVLEPLKYKPKMSPAEVITVAVVAARHFGNNLECALSVMRETGYIPKHRALSISRYNRQLHKQADFPAFCLQTLMELSIDCQERFFCGSGTGRLRTFGTQAPNALRERLRRHKGREAHALGETLGHL